MRAASKNRRAGLKIILSAVIIVGTSIAGPSFSLAQSDFVENATYRLEQLRHDRSDAVARANVLITRLNAIVRSPQCLYDFQIDSLVSEAAASISSLEGTTSHSAVESKIGLGPLPQNILSPFLFGPDYNRAVADIAKLRQLQQLLRSKRCTTEQSVLLPDPERPGNFIYLGGELIFNRGLLETIETLAGTGAITNQFHDSVDPAGAGFIVGYNFSPSGNPFWVSPFFSFDVMNQKINHVFTNGSFFGTTSHFVGTLGIKAGAAIPGGARLYGIGGVSFLNQDLNIQFGGPLTSKNVTVAGGTAGFGVSIAPKFLQIAGTPITLFAEYQHTWWQNARLLQPAASPAFNYSFHREDDTLKFGATVPVWRP